MPYEPMREDLSSYAQYTVSSLLRLSEGEALSINVEERDFPFARLAALSAMKLTHRSVKIVQTENGRPTDVIELDPDKPTDRTGRPVMLSIRHEKPIVNLPSDALDLIVDKDDFATLQKLSHLSEPVVLDRKISVPWACISVFDDNDSRWEELGKVISKDAYNASLVVDYRKKYLESLELETLRIKTPSSDFVTSIQMDSLFVGGSCSLPDGRAFLCTTDYETLCVNADPRFSRGVVRGKATLFGKTQDIELFLEEGMIVRHSPSKELDRLLDYDSALRSIGYLSFSNKQLSVHFGGALSECLGDDYETEDDLPADFNRSYYTFKVELETSFDIQGVSFDGKNTEIARRGFLLDN